MESQNRAIPSAFLFLASVLFLSGPYPVSSHDLITPSVAEQQQEAYIVHLQPPENFGFASAQDRECWHNSFLPESATDSRLIYSYAEVFSGFAARLTGREVVEMEKKDGFIRAYPDRLLPLDTTHTPDFLGLRIGNGVWNRSGFGEGVIVGLLDTGIVPGHPSFGDDGVPPPPGEWKGACEFKEFGCNNKVIGAKAVGGSSPLDDIGHGTHTASTAAGNFVRGADVLGNAKGTAAGMAPHAHLAIYKVCRRSRCSMVDIVAGFDAAVKDGVDVLSLSLGGFPAPFDLNPIAISAFAATEKGIFVSCSAGNNGPVQSSIANEAPWVLTVAAGTMGRSIRATVRLGDGREFDGESLFQPGNFSSDLRPLVYPRINSSTSPPDCSSLYGWDVVGKVVVCESRGFNGRVEEGVSVSAAGGAAMVLVNRKEDGYTTFADAHVLPASHVSYAAGSEIISYILSTKNPTAAIIFKGTIIGASPAPTVAFFSSRGPGKASPGILKPDVTGPGVNILAAWPPGSGAAMDQVFNMSGTSMSTPHLSGIAALIKSAHPSWSPAAIKSAIMTTSDAEDRDGNPIEDEQHQKASFFAMGAGHVNPSKAVDPGLVYDLDAGDYIAYLCGLGLGDSGVGAVARRSISCASEFKNITEAELNYPAILVSPLLSPVKVSRTVTNVGRANSTYTAELDVPKELFVSVHPQRLRFSRMNEKKSFAVRVGWSGYRKQSVEGNLRWVSDEYMVRSPIVVVAQH